jgi:hypothetical protein
MFSTRLPPTYHSSNLPVLLISCQESVANLSTTTQRGGTSQGLAESMLDSHQSMLDSHYAVLNYGEQVKITVERGH